MSDSNKRLQTVVLGLINLAGQDGALYKKTLICRTGVWKGMFGPVEVTGDRLQRIADKYNRERAKPINDFDYAPVLINHDRNAELVKGRVLADLAVEPFIDPDTGTEGKALYGTLRIDIPDAREKVKAGVYAQVSLSFDEDDDTLWEVSFVAVEAARRSQALKQGDSQMSVELQAQLKSATDSHQALQARVRESVTVRKAVALAAGENLSAAIAQLSEIHANLTAGLTASKTAILKSQFKGFVRKGQMNKAEFDKVEFGKLASMSAESISMLLASYKSRPVSPHVAQFGQSGAQPIQGKMTPAQTREAIKLQREGKSVRLAVEEPTGDKGQEDQKEAGADGADDADMSEYEDALKKMGEIEPVVGKAKEFLGKMNESLKKLGEQNEKDEKEKA